MSIADDIEIIVVDNDVSCTAKPVVDYYAKLGLFRVTYLSEHRKGLANVRNAALDYALLNADALAFIDDDELPSTNWVNALSAALQSSNADVILGPVTPLFEKQAPDWAADGGFYSKRLVPDSHGYLKDGYTCNAILRCSTLRHTGVRFDPRFNLTGGEDTLLFRELLRSGAKLGWSEKAVVYEWVPENRVRLSWLLTRWYRTGGIEAHLSSYAPDSWRGRITNFGRGTARVAGGLLLVGLAFVSHGWRDRSRTIARLYSVARGAGLIASAFGQMHEEYRTPM